MDGPGSDLVIAPGLWAAELGCCTSAKTDKTR